MTRPDIIRGQIWKSEHCIVFVTSVWHEDYYGDWHVSYMSLYQDWCYKDSAYLNSFVKALTQVTDKDEIFECLNILKDYIEFRQWGWMLKSRAIPLSKSEKGILMLSHKDA